MEFNLPTNKQQMYTILNDLFYYYRIKRQTFERLELQELELERLTYAAPTDDELLALAKTQVAPDNQREIDERKESLSSNINEIQTKISTLEQNAENQILEVEMLYQESVAAIEKQAVKNGLISSGILVDKIAALEEGKNTKITEININKDQELVALNAKLSALNASLENVEDYFAIAHQKDVDKALEELKSKRQDKIDEVFKYNNTLDEKEQRSKNSVLQANANLELKYLEISSGEFSKDQLVEMGYYDDVIRCVCGYYDTLTPIIAYQEISSDKKVPIYLDDYYQNIVYMYKVKSDA